MTPVYSNTFLLIGTVIGAGIFSLPIALKQAGWFYFISLLLSMSFLLGWVSLLYREIVDSTQSKHQLPGYAKMILGSRVGYFAVITMFLSTAGALLAYLIIGGQFVANVLRIPSAHGSMVFYLAVICITLVGGEHMKLFDIAFSVIKLLLIAVVIVLSAVTTPYSGLGIIKAIGDQPLRAYGGILFALTGVSIMPELKKDKRIKMSVLISSAITVIAYALFAFGYFGRITETNVGIDDPLFDITGIFTILTPYLLLTWVAFDLLHKDMKIERHTAMAVTHALPLILYVLGLRNFTSVISLTGGVFLGYIVLIIMAMYRKKFPKKHPYIIPLIQGVFIIGVCLEIWNFFIR